MEQTSVRNLEQIQEADGGRSTPRGVTILLVALGGACVVFAGMAFTGRKSTSTAKTDPLGELVAQQAKAGAKPVQPTDLHSDDVTFPGILSDHGAPPTAMAAVPRGRDGANPALRPSPTSTAETVPVAPGTAPPPTDRLTVVPLPAQQVLEASPVVKRPRDSLTRAANDATQGAPQAQAAPAGREGGYQLQVSSFRTQAEADSFSTQLRARGHKAYVVEAHVPGRGTWYRVRIGPFSTQRAASVYRAGFEGREHVVPFIVPPHK
jgi:DedD protein